MRNTRSRRRIDFSFGTWFPRMMVVVLFLLMFSNTVGGMAARAAMSVWLAWLGLIDFDTYMWFATEAYFTPWLCDTATCGH